MDIGPIPAIGPLSAVQPKRVDRDLSGVFQVEFQREQHESYTPHRQSADRGLEDEETSPETEELIDLAAALREEDRSQPGVISFFA